MELKLIMSDVHVPYHSPQSVECFLRVLQATQPTELVIIGDFLDCLAQARWSVGAREQYDNSLVPKEIDAGKRLLGDIRRLYDGPIKYHLGNHEHRHTRAVAKFLPWATDVMPSIGELLDFAGHKITQLGEVYPIAPGAISIHGNKLSSTQNAAGQSAYKERMRHGKSIVQGHSHRLGLGWDTSDRERFWLECGWLGDTAKAAYLDFKGLSNWQTGFGALWIDGRNVYPQAVKVSAGRCRFDGATFDAAKVAT
jgi:predicted phosphodiesterase